MTVAARCHRVEASVSWTWRRAGQRAKASPSQTSFYLSCQQKLLPTGMMGLSTLIKWGRSLTVRPVTYLLAGSGSTHINNQEHPLRRISPNSPDFIGLMRLMFWPPKLQEHRRASLPDSPYFYSQTLLRGESGEQAGDSPLVSTWPWFLLTWEETKTLASLLGVRGPPEQRLLANGMSFNPRKDPGRRKYRHRPCCGRTLEMWHSAKKPT